MNDQARHLTTTERLNNAARERRWENQRPKDAATLIIIDRRRRTPKVLMGRRHEGHKFMPGKFVFPGGRIEAGDRSMPVAGMLHPVSEARLVSRVTRLSLARARALALAAVRETFEETGLLIGSRDYGPPEHAPEGPWRAFVEHGVFPDLEALQFVARAITPPRRPKRFDTRFFAVDATAIAATVPDIVGPQSELTELVWVSLPDAKRLDLPTITHVIIEELEARIAAGFAHELPVPFYYERRGRFVREEL
ncbi:NUDIX hydrolase [Chelatococcus composti]|uniref:8-oxo-dGTP pyrophosphatase MutT (NUDIX family) n=1 Tax=Chelatococcus composti TaxID=1743235 RepID=A0A841KG20_9HYPH|nr:8-oxo-dGTP pyrophosphatase MutT (NUDIX family) [Chelatococcus composti]MBS7736725.1 NUDIX hydrolase [Chelatococcus composti]PZN42389.1 MAG: NUDIX hydrolase [Pseudomonadota bacterium]GGG38134.1 NUDIX hydrolase [Chelatococcus composti]